MPKLMSRNLAKLLACGFALALLLPIDAGHGAELVRPIGEAVGANPLVCSDGAPGLAADPGSITAELALPSFAHSSLRTLTYEVGATLNNFVFLSLATGSVVTGGGLTAFNTLQSWTVFTINDYLWNLYSPPQIQREGEAFDAEESLRRTSWKYLTGKPVVTFNKILAISLYTGSLSTGLFYGLSAATGSSVIFFLNNIAWDYYSHLAMQVPSLVADCQHVAMQDESVLLSSASLIPLPSITSGRLRDAQTLPEK